MALPASGNPISLGQVNTELSLGATATISMDNSAVRTLFGKIGAGTIISMSDGHGKSAVAAAFNGTISSNQQELNLRTWALANGWNGSGAATITIASGVYIWSNNTAVAALTINGSWPGGVTVINNGFIIGKGGRGSGTTSSAWVAPEAGGPAISLGVSCTINNTNATAYIAGGGGGGGSGGGGLLYGGYNTWGFGGGGAGGGAGGQNGSNAVGAGGGLGGAGGNGSYYSAGVLQTGGTLAIGGGSGGGAGARIQVANRLGPVILVYTPAGGGRVLPGVGGAAGRVTAGTGGSGGSGNAPGNAGIDATVSGAVYGGGGGGWGAAGGRGGNIGTTLQVGTPGGAGGRSVQLNGFSVTWVGGNTTRVYGAVS